MPRPWRGVRLHTIQRSGAWGSSQSDNRCGGAMPPAVNIGTVCGELGIDPRRAAKAQHHSAICYALQDAADLPPTIAGGSRKTSTAP
jgi:hypothetical protein